MAESYKRWLNHIGNSVSPGDSSRQPQNWAIKKRRVQTRQKKRVTEKWSGLWDSNPRSQPWEGRMLPLHQARLKGFLSKAYQMMCQKSTRVPPTGLEPARPKGTGPQPAAYTIPPRGLAKLLWCLAQRTLQYSRLRAFCQLLYAGWRRCCRRLYTLATQPSFGLANEPGAFCFSCFERARTGTMR